MATWNIEATRQHVKRLFGKDQYKLARPSLQSAIERQDYARYHYHEANDLFNRFASERLAEASLIEVAWSQDEDERSEFQELVTKVGANVVACIQSMHAVADILAHAVYYSVGLNLTEKALPEAGITASSVVKHIAQLSELAEVHRLLESLINKGQFAHLAGLVNHSKHRSIIRVSVSEDLTGKKPERHTLKLPGFYYKKYDYPEVEARAFIQQEFDRNALLVIEVGNALNAALQAK